MLVNNVPYYEWFGILFISFMFTHLVWRIQKRLDKQVEQTETERWVSQYEKDVPTVWK